MEQLRSLHAPHLEEPYYNGSHPPNRGSPHAALSNFYQHAFVFDDKEYMTAEHAFQRAKFAGVSARHDEYAVVEMHDVPLCDDVGEDVAAYTSDDE